jgi:hypothetical protein
MPSDIFSLEEQFDLMHQLNGLSFLSDQATNGYERRRTAQKILLESALIKDSGHKNPLDYMNEKEAERQKKYAALKPK